MEDTPSHLCCRAETNSVADSVINDEVVFASGEIADANSTSRQDLWLETVSSFFSLKAGNQQED